VPPSLRQPCWLWILTRGPLHVHPALRLRNVR
jgi:hypothetical protein